MLYSLKVSLIALVTTGMVAADWRKLKMRNTRASFFQDKSDMTNEQNIREKREEKKMNWSIYVKEKRDWEKGQQRTLWLLTIRR